MTSTLNKEGKSPSQYGLLSLIAIIIGTVIGSGIYVKNDSLVQGSGSIIVSTIAWVLGGLIVLAMLISFIEIVSITNKRNEQGTFTAWSRYLWGEKTAKFLGGYFLFVYLPLIIATESIFAANEFKLIFTADTPATDNNVLWFFLITIIALLVILAAFLTTTYFIKPGEIVQSAGTVIKMIPLLFIVVLLFVILAMPDSGDYLNTGAYDPSSPVNDPNGNGFYQLLLILPAVLFAFDGFLFAASLSTEAKTQTTYKTALIISVFIITFSYLFFSIASFFLGNSDSGYEINQIILSIFTAFGLEQLGKDLQITTSIIIMLSITTAVFGYSLTSMWTLSDNSNLDEIVDKEGLMIRRNYKGIPTYAGLRMLYLSFFSILILRGLDGIYLLSPSTDNNSAIEMTDYLSNLFTLTNFMMYSTIIIGGIANRKTHKVNTDKQKGFFVASIFAVIMIILAVVSLAYSLIDGLFISQNEDAVILKTISIVLFVFSVFLVYFFNYWHTQKNVSKNKEYKNFYRSAYNKKIPFEKYLKEYDDIEKEYSKKYEAYKELSFGQKAKNKMKANYLLFKEIVHDFKSWIRKLFKKSNK